MIGDALESLAPILICGEKGSASRRTSARSVVDVASRHAQGGSVQSLSTQKTALDQALNAKIDELNAKFRTPRANRLSRN